MEPKDAHDDESQQIGTNINDWFNSRGSTAYLSLKYIDLYVII